MTKGERIRTLRERMGRSLTDFADDIGVSKQTLYKYENNIITNIPSDKIEAIADKTNVSPGFIMGWEPEYPELKLKPLGKLGSEDIELLKAYHSAPENIQAGIRQVLGL